MYGRIFASMFTGSMVGKGSPVFAVMSYVICHMRADDEVGAQVDLNTTLLSVMIGEPESVIKGAIDYLCSPDPNTTSPEEEGRRLVKVGAFAYRVVNGAKYMAIRNAEEQRESARLRKVLQRERDKTEAARPVSSDPFGGNEDPPETRPKKFTPPTLEDLKLLMAKSGLPATEAEKFFNYYGSNGWRVGRNPMKSLPHAVANWAANVRQGTFVKNGVSKNDKPDYSKGF